MDCPTAVTSVGIVEFAMRHARTQFSNRVRSRRCGEPIASGILQICALLALLSFAQIGRAETNITKTVLVLYDGGREFVAIQRIDHGIESALNDALSNRVTIFREYMDLTRIRQTNYEQAL